MQHTTTTFNIIQPQKIGHLDTGDKDCIPSEISQPKEEKYFKNLSSIWNLRYLNSQSQGIEWYLSRLEVEEMGSCYAKDMNVQSSDE